ncbi:MAG: multidrug effflux MFS transporter [Gammaproteobacteria bacterium]|nr:multidrug effflux MFS transporter [Gammaproteobacteria bacterium]
MFYNNVFKTHHLPLTSRNKIVFLITLFLCFLQLGIDIYLPSMPAMQNYFHTSAAAVQNTLTLYLIGFGSIQLFAAIFADYIGRRPILLCGLSLYFVASLGCVMTNDITVLLICRLLQGFAAGMAQTAYRAALRDIVTDNKKIAKIFSHLATCWAVVPIVAPLLGGYIQDYFNWRMNFIVLFALSAIILLLAWKLFPETQQETDRSSPRQAWQDYMSILANKGFFSLAIVCALSAATLMAYTTASPFLLQVQLHVTPIQFGWAAFAVAGGILIGSFLNRQLVYQLGTKKLLIVACALGLISTFAFFILSYQGVFTVTAIIIPIWILAFSKGISFPNFFANAISSIKKDFAKANAVIGTLQQMAMGITAAFIAELHEQTALPLAWLLLSLMVIITIIFIWQRKNIQS